MPREATRNEATRNASTVNDPRWASVRARDAHADGTFVYAVRSTGVYCRPSCAARTPRPENVTFHVTPEAAERAGYRACLRCKPKSGGRASEHAAIVAKLCRFIEDADRMPSLDALAEISGMSPHYTQRLFKAVTGLTPRAYAAGKRAARVRETLGRGRPVTEAMYDAGFGSSGRFYEATDGALGMTPSRFRDGGEGVVIRFAVGQCSLGAILVAATERGVCAVLLGDEPEPLVRDLERRFARATLVGADAAFEALVAQVVGLVEAPALSVSLPLDVRGTAFQERVWRALREIPAGTTVTYTELATRIGAPSAVRAVASACGANPVAVAIPCHRVVRIGGDLSGYRWGIERKRTLLAREARP